MDGNEEEQQQPAEVAPTPAVRRVPRSLAALVRRTGRALAGRSRRADGTEHPRPSRRRRLAVALAVVVVAFAGVIIGTLLGGHVRTDVGPFQAEMSIAPSTTGETTVRIPPLGALEIDSHRGPVRLTVQLGSLDQRRTEALIDDPASISRASQSAVHDVTDGVIRLGLRTVGAALLATLLLAALAFRDVRRVAWSGLLSLVVVGAALGTAALTMRPQAIEEPRYEGLLVNAPAIVGDARRIANDYSKYSEQLQRLVANVSKLYTTVSTLPVYQPAPGTARILHVSDMHLNPTAWSLMRTVVEQFNIDAVIDTGDITDWGSEPEASFVGSIGLLGKPYIFIRGNHDSPATAAAVGRQPNAIVLDNSITTVAGITIAGIGDPRFTPDKSTSPGGGNLTQPTADQLIGSSEKLAGTVRGANPPVNIALVHDPASAGPLAGTCRLVLAGHLHRREVSRLPQTPGAMPTELMVQGSTGGAGLRGLEGEKPTPLTMSVLYFDPQKQLQAYDDIQVGGTGQSQVNLERHVISDPAVGDKSVPVTPTPTR
ncbi:metallophosphoesterase [Micromonospora sp. NPDC049559]|uniref:metallophosphoesterase family protein n=1 Tax=Micromonospora sp. NPDC049559 TaxID=3155923 RepID=UPI00343A1751